MTGAPATGKARTGGPAPAGGLHCAPDMETIDDFQTRMRELYGARDRERGLARTFAWSTEECGELSTLRFLPLRVPALTG